MSDESDQAGLILIAHFLRFPYEKLSNSLDSSTASCDTSASSAAFSRSATFCDKLRYNSALPKLN